MPWLARWIIYSADLKNIACCLSKVYKYELNLYNFGMFHFT